MAHIYIALVDTPGLFARIIRRVIGQRYIHVALGLDPFLDEAYSIGRRHPAVPLIAGFEREEKEKILHAFPSAEYLIYRMECTEEQKKFVEERLRDAMENRFRYHYAVAGLPFILWKIPFYQKDHYTCSSYIAKLLEEAGICRWDKHFSLVTPRDFMEYEKKEFFFEGSLRDLVRAERQGYAAGRLILHQAASPFSCPVEQTVCTDAVYPGTVYSGVTAYER